MKRRYMIILGLLMAAVMLPVVAFAADDSSEETGAQGEVCMDGSYMDLGGTDVTNDSKLKEIIDEINRNSDVKREISGPRDRQKDKQEDVSDLGRLRVLSTSVNYKNYTYKITPLLPPFNEYYFVETGNPDPKSFRFADKASKYSDSATIAWDWDDWDNKVTLYADVKYDNNATARVGGGYIFYSGSTDGGQVVMQVTDNPDAWSPDWNDTAIKLTLPSAVDETDYLINTYAKKDNFFGNMDAVQDGFSSICLYSGSFIRGTVTKPNKYWYVSIAGHLDQSFYIFSPFDREDNRPLFASSIYPFRYDSWGFPGMMASVAKRLDSSATYKWNDSAHYLIDVTYNGEIRSYGGQGNGKGQGVPGDKILQQFKFGAGGTTFTLTNMYALLNDYAALKVDDDIPRDDELTWKQIYNTVGSSGSWARVAGSFWDTGDIWSCGKPQYAFFYQDGDGTSFSDDEWGIGYNLYWGGDLGYARDVWVDGRYVDEWRSFVPGETFAKHPTSGIILRDVTIPQITYDYKYVRNPSTSQYEIVYSNVNVREETKTALFNYEDGKWEVSGLVFDDGCAQYDRIAEIVEQGLLDEQYLDMVTITQDEIAGLNIDGNTNAVPDKGYIFDGTDAPGTVFDESIGHCWYLGEITNEPTCTAAGKASIVCQVCGEAKTETIPAKGHANPMDHVAAKPGTCMDIGNIEYWHCWKCDKYFADKDGKKQLDEDSIYIWDVDHNWKHVKNPAGLLKNGSEYDQCTFCKEKINVKKLAGYATYYVKGFKLAPAKKAFTAKWKKQSTKNQKKFNGYQIRYSTKSSMKGAKYKTAGKKSSSKKITKLKKKTKYYVQVRTYTISKNVKYYSKWSQKKVVKTK